MTGIIVGTIIGIIAVVGSIVAVLYAAGIIKKEFQVSRPALGVAPVVKEQLMKMLLRLNNNKVFTINSDEYADLALEWKIIDAKWTEVLGKAWLNKTYRAWLMLDEDKKMLKYNESITEKGFTAGPTGASYEVSSFRGIQLWRKERGYRWGIKDDFTIGEIYDYKFSPQDVKEVIRQIANDNGWGFGLVATKKQVAKVAQK